MSSNQYVHIQGFNQNHDTPRFTGQNAPYPMPASHRTGADMNAQHPGKFAWKESPLLVTNSHSGTARSFRSLFYQPWMLNCHVSSIILTGSTNMDSFTLKPLSKYHYCNCTEEDNQYFKVSLKYMSIDSFTCPPCVCVSSPPPIYTNGSGL